jgi:hypothetical protein
VRAFFVISVFSLADFCNFRMQFDTCYSIIQWYNSPSMFLADVLVKSICPLPMTHTLLMMHKKQSKAEAVKVAPYSFRSVSLKFCPRERLVVLHATRVVDVACVAGFFKLRFQRIYLLRQNIVIYTRGPSWDCRLVARGNWNPDFCDVT